MKFNMGCGLKNEAGWINVDSSSASAADEVFDLEVTPWPWPDNCAEAVMFIHSLEHMGGDPKVFLAIMQELYRIAAPGCRVKIHVPHPRHDHFLNDPTHVRPITPGTLNLFNRELNETWRAAGNANTPLALYLGVDFRIIHQEMMLDDTMSARLDRGEVTKAELAEMARRQNNIASEYRFVLEVRKDAAA